MTEARVAAGHQPVAATHEAGTLATDVNAADERLERSLDHVPGKLGHENGLYPPRGLADGYSARVCWPRAFGAMRGVSWKVFAVKQ